MSTPRLSCLRVLDRIEGALCSMANGMHNGGYLDATTGQHLRPELVKVARALEMDSFTSKKVYTKVPREESFKRIGKAPITVKWSM